MNIEFSSLVNPPHESIDTQTTRFSGAEWFNLVRSSNIMLAGVGGIGSWLALMLSRLNPLEIRLIDPDQVDDSNLAGQFFNNSDIGKDKVEAVYDFINKYSLYRNVSYFTEHITMNSNVWRILMCGFDNMNARRTAFECWKRRVEGLSQEQRHTALFIDGRLSAENLQVFCITGTDTFYMKEYEEKWLFSDEEAESTVCSYKQTSYCANLIASIMTNLFVNWITNKCSPLVERSLPFFTEYTAEQMFLKTEV